MSNSFEYEIAIPSYQRSHRIKKGTLAMLEEAKIPKDRITIFVQNDPEYDMYKKELGDEYRIISIKKPAGIMHMRNYIALHYAEDTNVIHMDDDIEEVLIKHPVTEKLVKIDDLVLYFKLFFSSCREFKTKIWGIYPVKNAFFMKQSMSSDLKFIVSCFYGTIVTHDPDLLVTINHKQDYERTIKYYLKYGTVLRFNDITVKTKYYDKDGGMNAAYGGDRRIDNDISTQKLMERYPEFVTLKKKTHRDMAQIRLRDSRK